VAEIRAGASELTISHLMTGNEAQNRALKKLRTLAELVVEGRRTDDAIIVEPDETTRQARYKRAKKETANYNNYVQSKIKAELTSTALELTVGNQDELMAELIDKLGITPPTTAEQVAQAAIAKYSDPKVLERDYNRDSRIGTGTNGTTAKFLHALWRASLSSTDRVMMNKVAAAKGTIGMIADMRRIVGRPEVAQLIRKTAWGAGSREDPLLILYKIYYAAAKRPRRHWLDDVLSFFDSVRREIEKQGWKAQKRLEMHEALRLLEQKLTQAIYASPRDIEAHLVKLQKEETARQHAENRQEAKKQKLAKREKLAALPPGLRPVAAFTSGERERMAAERSELLKPTPEQVADQVALQAWGDADEEEQDRGQAGAAGQPARQDEVKQQAEERHRRRASRKEDGTERRAEDWRPTKERRAAIAWEEVQSRAPNAELGLEPQIAAKATRVPAAGRPRILRSDIFYGGNPRIISSDVKSPTAEHERGGAENRGMPQAEREIGTQLRLPPTWVESPGEDAIARRPASEEPDVPHVTQLKRGAGEQQEDGRGRKADGGRLPSTFVLE
jgi:hypothetical protein